MHMGTGGAAGVADRSDLVAALDTLTDLDEILGIVPVVGSVAVAMIDDDHLAVSWHRLRLADDTVGGRSHRRAGPGRDIVAFMHFTPAGKRVAAHAEPGTGPAPNRPPRRLGRQQGALVVQKSPDLLLAFPLQIDLPAETVDGLLKLGILLADIFLTRTADTRQAVPFRSGEFGHDPDFGIVLSQNHHLLAEIFELGYQAVQLFPLTAVFGLEPAELGSVQMGSCVIEKQTAQSHAERQQAEQSPVQRRPLQAEATDPMRSLRDNQNSEFLGRQTDHLAMKTKRTGYPLLIKEARGHCQVFTGRHVARVGRHPPYGSIIKASSSQSGNFAHFMQSRQIFCGSSAFSIELKPSFSKKNGW